MAAIPESSCPRSGPSALPRSWHADPLLPGLRSPRSVVEAAQALGLVAEESGTAAEALDRALELAGRDDLVLVTGSLYVVGAARTALS